MPALLETLSRSPTELISLLNQPPIWTPVSPAGHRLQAEGPVHLFHSFMPSPAIEPGIHFPVPVRPNGTAGEEPCAAWLLPFQKNDAP
ncbi:MAG: hypothetical protein U5K33_08720 [Halofilum sp. (in: g-proteobacteria)]|nr:hypothetical protein [Halofilum sp. (in: g-proteobacteria)]